MKYGDKIIVVNSPTLNGKTGIFVREKNRGYIVVQIGKLEMCFHRENIKFIK